MATVDLKDVKKVYAGGVEAVKGVSIAIPDKALCVLVGPSGCGKSTLLRMIAGLETISAGTCAFDGKVVNEIGPTERDIAMVFQNYALYPHRRSTTTWLTACATAACRTTRSTSGCRQSPRRWSWRICSTGGHANLSGGQRQRVAMGRAIVRNPKVFLFDEPLSNLDAKLRGQMRVEIKKLQRELEVTSVYVTHDQLEAMTLADLLVVMNGGLVEQMGNPLDIYEKPASTFVASFIGAPPMNLLSIAEGKTANGTSLTAAAPANAAIIGFRPEDADVVNKASAGGLTLEAVVDGVEPVGAESFLYCTAAGERVVVRVSGRSVAELGDKLTIVAPVAKLHWFDEGGKRVGS